jgi:hypothetical protein
MDPLRPADAGKNPVYENNEPGQNFPQGVQGVKPSAPWGPGSTKTTPFNDGY